MSGQGAVRYLWGNMKLLLLLVFGLMLCRDLRPLLIISLRILPSQLRARTVLRKAAFNIIVNARDDQAALKKYAQALETILVYLDRPEIRDMTAGDIVSEICGFND